MRQVLFWFWMKKYNDHANLTDGVLRGWSSKIQALHITYHMGHFLCPSLCTHSLTFDSSRCCDNGVHLWPINSLSHLHHLILASWSRASLMLLLAEAGPLCSHCAHTGSGSDLNPMGQYGNCWVNITQSPHSSGRHWGLILQDSSKYPRRKEPQLPIPVTISIRCPCIGFPSFPVSIRLVL